MSKLGFPRESRVDNYAKQHSAMVAVTRLAFLATAVVFHLVYLFSIFDIYFVSPIVSGMRLVGVERPASAKPPADRLVLIVGMFVLARRSWASLVMLPLRSPADAYHLQATDCVRTRPSNRFQTLTPSRTAICDRGL